MQTWECFADKWEGLIVGDMPMKYVEFAVSQRVLKLNIMYNLNVKKEKCEEKEKNWGKIQNLLRRTEFPQWFRKGNFNSFIYIHDKMV